MKSVCRQSQLVITTTELGVVLLNLNTSWLLSLVLTEWFSMIRLCFWPSCWDVPLLFRMMAHDSREWHREMRWCGHLGIIEEVIIREDDHTTHVFNTVYSDQMCWLINRAKSKSTQFPMYLENHLCGVLSFCFVQTKLVPQTLPLVCAVWSVEKTGEGRRKRRESCNKRAKSPGLIKVSQPYN